MNTCPKCGSIVEEDVRFCTFCGCEIQQDENMQKDAEPEVQPAAPAFGHRAPENTGSGNEKLAKIMFLVTIVLCLALVAAVISGARKLSSIADNGTQFSFGQLFGKDNTPDTGSAGTDPQEAAPELSINPDVGFFIDDGFYELIDASELQPGLEYFYDVTGVKPFIYFLSDYPDGFEDISEVAEAVYDQIIGEEYGGHLVLAWYESAEEYADTYYWLGEEALEIISEDDLQTLTDNISECYDDSELYPTYGDLLSAAFEMTADEIR